MGEDISGKVVVDASFILAFLLPDERVDEVDEKFDLYEDGKIALISTKLLPFEILNGLRNSILRKRITKPVAPGLLSEFFKLKITFEEIEFKKMFLLSLKENLSIYDASYVFLARSKGIPLLTQDGRLKKLAG